MPVYTTSSARPREELALAIVEGEGAADNLIGEKILPSYGINSRTAHVIKAALADSQGLRSISADKYIHAPGTKFERMTAVIGDDTFTVTLRGLEVVIPLEAQLDYKPYLDLEMLFMRRFGLETSALTKEALVAAAVFNTTNFGSATNSTTAYTVANLATLTFVSDVIASIRRVRAKGENPDTVAMSGPIYERIRQATLVQGFANGTLRPGSDVTVNSIQAMLAEHGIKQVLIGDAYQNTAADGATASLAQLWSNTYIWVGKAGRMGVSAASEGVTVPTIAGAGALVYWEEYQQGGRPGITNSITFPGGNYVESYPETNIDSEIVRVKMSHKPYTSGTRSGDLIATQYS